MIYTIVGTHPETRDKANKEIAALGQVTDYIYSEKARALEMHLDAQDMFGGTTIITCVQLGDVASSKEILVDMLPRLEASSSIFIIDEPFADIHLINKLKKVSKKLFDAKEEKVKDVSVFKLCDSFAKKDKKQAWVDFIDVRTRESAESIQGALWWKFQIVWQGVKDGKKSPFSLSDCERIGGDLVRSSILAHRGEKDLMTELEKIILSL